MANFEDFRDDKGNVDWAAYRSTRVSIGEECMHCSKLIHLEGIDAPGHPESCRDCKNMIVDQGEVSHGDYIRCPACGNRITVHDGDSYELLSDGEHEVMCNECEFEFAITTDVTYIFTSPARLEDEE